LMIVALLGIVYFLPSLKTNIPLAIALISTTLFGFQFQINNIQTLPADYFHGKNVGTVTGMSGTAAVAGTLTTTWLVPVITKTSYDLFFLLAALLVPVAWLCIRLLFRKRQIEPQRRAAQAVPLTER
jgi:MFS transporter, ACS family, hexuronate transporter